MTSEEVQNMIDKSIVKAIDEHNKSAMLISAVIGSILLFFYAHGVLAVIDRVQ